MTTRTPVLAFNQGREPLVGLGRIPLKGHFEFPGVISGSGDLAGNGKSVYMAVEDGEENAYSSGVPLKIVVFKGVRDIYYFPVRGTDHGTGLKRRKSPFGIPEKKDGKKR